MPHRPVRELIANQQIFTGAAKMTVAKAAEGMREAKVGAILVMDGKRLAGIFTERDALYRVVAEGLDPKKLTLAEAMTPDPATISPDMPFGHALHIMYERGFRHVPVVEDGKPVGMVSARDALGPELQQFAEELDQREHIAEILG